MDTAELKVAEAHDKDWLKNTARISYGTMHSIGASIGDILEITGEKQTFVICLPLFDADGEGKIIRIDALTRANAGTTLGLSVTVRKVVAKLAEKVKVRAVESLPPIDGQYIAAALEKKPIVKGDHLLIPYNKGRVDVRVEETIPGGEPVLVGTETAFVIIRKDDHYEGIFPGGLEKRLMTGSQLENLRTLVAQYERDLAAKHVELKNHTRKLIKENHTIDEIRSLTSGINEELLYLNQRLLNVYRQYVRELEAQGRDVH